MRFRDRWEAGKKLAEKLLKKYSGIENGVVLGIPRGGVVVARVVAEDLNLSLDVIVSRKLRAPYNPELAIGAISEYDAIYLNKDIILELGVSKDYLKSEIERQKKRLEEYVRKFREGRKLNLKNRVAIIVDDGIATGATVIAAALAARNGGAGKVVIATPVVSEDIYHLVKNYCDELIDVYRPVILWAVGVYYEDFSQVSDYEVIEILKTSKRPD